MARKKSHKSTNSTRNTRDIFNIASPSLSFQPRDLYRATPIEDRRVFHPDRALRSVRYFSNQPVSYKASPRRGPIIPTGVSFVNPAQVPVCKRRKTRREVMFARNGAGSRKMKRPVHTILSDVRC